MPTTLSERLREAIGKEVTQADLARACKISRAAVTKWMDGSVDDLKTAHLFAVARLCNVDAEWLGLGTGPKRRSVTSIADGATPEYTTSERASSPQPTFENRHVALLQAYLTLPRDTRSAVRMLIETLAGVRNPAMREFTRKMEDHNHRRDATPAITGKRPRKPRPIDT
jgi:transcriptional regulator with XRE-family HTH domain